ncbi:preprotein translocase subunit SecE [Anaerotardibacter muris]|uniref:preprotein translocase subunit SecE n=1 Tax=Anaerotardibacter muris TaxID=2941505 RepID=UPI00203E7E89|nr:preprotein translocase subunit SecE [Anaerotardibacter muris]
MAKKSKTQKAKASAKKAAKKAASQELDNQEVVAVEEPKKKGVFSKKETRKEEKQKQENLQDYQIKAEEAKPKKRRFQFFSDVRAEMRRVTWPSRQDVMQWTGVVIVALLFFGVFTLILDDWIVTPLLFAISSLGV